MMRYRWVEVSWPITMHELFLRLKENQYTDNSIDGFIVDRAFDNFLEARFIQKIEYTDSLTDPLGNNYTITQVNFQQHEFRASIDRPYFELINPSRNVQICINRLATILDHSFFIKPVCVDVISWAAKIQQLTKTVSIVDSLQISQFELEHGVNAKITVSGNKDVRQTCDNFINGRNHSIEKLQLRMPSSEGYVSLILGKNGTARLNFQNEDLVQILRLSFSSLF